MFNPFDRLKKQNLDYSLREKNRHKKETKDFGEGSLGLFF